MYEGVQQRKKIITMTISIRTSLCFAIAIFPLCVERTLWNHSGSVVGFCEKLSTWSINPMATALPLEGYVLAVEGMGEEEALLRRRPFFSFSLVHGTRSFLATVLLRVEQLPFCTPLDLQ